MEYERIVLIGFGKIAEECFRYILLNYYGVCAIDLIIYERHQLSRLPQIAAEHDIVPFISDKRKDIREFLMSVSEKSIIVSANNNFIFPAGVVEKPNLKIVNFHNALLPHHRGRNAPTWSIFEQDNVSGITWHIVDAKIDNGDIIYQEKIPLNEKETALTLLKKGQDAGIEGFKKFFPDLINGKGSFTKQEKLENYVIHYSTDVPNDGILDTEWRIDKISAFLRALDYGPLDFFDGFVMINGDKVLIKGYKIFPSNGYSYKRTITYDDNKINIVENNLKIEINLSESYG